MSSATFDALFYRRWSKVFWRSLKMIECELCRSHLESLPNHFQTTFERLSARFNNTRRLWFIFDNLWNWPLKFERKDLPQLSKMNQKSLLNYKQFKNSLQHIRRPSICLKGGYRDSTHFRRSNIHQGSPIFSSSLTTFDNIRCSGTQL